MGAIYFVLDTLLKSDFEYGAISFSKDEWMILVVALLLMILNWHLEALRWVYSVRTFEKISIKAAWQSVLAGLALNWILPFSSGDLVARIYSLNDKYQATSAALLNRGIMLGCTLLIGSYGAFYMTQQITINGWILLLVIIVIALLLIWLMPKAQKLLTYFKKLPTRPFILIVTISVLRYAVFVVQAYLLLWMFIPTLPTHLILAGIGWVFLVRSVVPIFFGGLGVREASGILFFQHYVPDLELVVLPLFLLWIINTVIPSFLGFLMVWKLPRFV